MTVRPIRAFLHISGTPCCAGEKGTKESLSCSFHTMGHYPLGGPKLILVDCNQNSKEKKSENRKYQRVLPIVMIPIAL